MSIPKKIIYVAIAALTIGLGGRENTPPKGRCRTSIKDNNITESYA